MPIAVINKPVDEGCAYLYGGSWGISWPEIFKKFIANTGPRADWLTIFTNNSDFGEDMRRHLYPSYVINALIIQQIEKDKGFNSVKELLSCGKYQVGNQNYFVALYHISAIDLNNFNQKIQELINKEAINFSNIKFGN